MRFLLVSGLLSLFLCGCGGLGAKGTRYLRESQPFQLELTRIQQEMRQSATLAPPQRLERIQQLLKQTQDNHQRLRQLQPSPKVAAVHQELDTLYTTLEEYLQACLVGSGQNSDPKVEKLTRAWSEHLQKLQDELQKLDSR